MEPDAQLDLRQAVVEAWAEFVIAAPEDRETAKARYRTLLDKFTEQVMHENPKSKILLLPLRWGAFGGALHRRDQRA
jgi:hypothetical protein